MFTIECFNGMPTEYDAFLISKYDSFITTCSFIDKYYSAFKINYLIISENDVLKELLIFGIHGHTCTCLNSLSAIDEAVFAECITIIFGMHPEIEKIKIAGSYNSYCIKNSIPTWQTDDYVLSLHSKIEDYYDELGSKWRRSIWQHQYNLTKDYPDALFVTAMAEGVSQESINKIIELNILQLKRQGKHPEKKTSNKENIYHLAKQYGCVAYIEAEGQIVAGSIAFILNKRVFHIVATCDKVFSRYNATQLCQLLIIKECIEQNMCEFHFLWGADELKNSRIVKPRKLYSYDVYRSNSILYALGKAKNNIKETLQEINHANITKPLRSLQLWWRRKIHRYQVNHPHKLTPIHA